LTATLARPLSNMDVSLIIASRDRCGQLQRCLDAVACLQFERPWELIVVDNGSTDDTAQVIQRFRANAPLEVRYVLEPHPGLGNAHNAGVVVARGKIVAFTDDDCYPEPDFLSFTWSAFQDLSVGYITGRITLHDRSDHPITINESTTLVTFPGRSFLGIGAVAGANMAFRREVLLEVGGFDPLFGPGSLFNAEELDVASRASAAGWKGEYRPEVVVRHHHGRKAADAPRLLKSYAVGAGAHHMKLLLNGEFLWFLQSIYQLPRRYRFSGRMVAYEPVGAIKYAYHYLKAALCGKFGVTPGRIVRSCRTHS
jgi:glycosyltransferase involved in cell wall biosynthesis